MKSLSSRRIFIFVLAFTYLFGLCACANQSSPKTVTLKLEAAYVFDLGISQDVWEYTLTEEESAYMQQALSKESQSKEAAPATDGIHFCMDNQDWLYFPDQAAAQNTGSGKWISFTEEENSKIADIYQTYLKQHQVEPLASRVDNTNLDKVVEDNSLALGDQTEDRRIKPHGTISSGMVLQRNCVNCLTGTTKDSKIFAVWNGKTYAGTITDGKFSIYLPPAEAGGPYTLTLYTEQSKRTLTDIYVGEVFLLSGQSNMPFPVSHAESGTGKTYEAVGDRIVQAVIVSQGSSSEPKTNTSVTWQSAGRDFSIIGYLFGLEMYDTLEVPIGLVLSATGGTSLSYWLPKTAYKELSSEQYVYITPGKEVCGGYNAMIAPLNNMRFRGVIWYQGEGNSVYPDGYATELETLIKSYRQEFNDPNLTFTIVGLPKYEVNSDGWAEIRKAQQQVASTVENVCLAVSIDQGDMKDIHPVDKEAIAKRVTQVTLESFFGVDCPNPPTVVKAEKISANQVVLTLKNADGLVAKNGVNGFQFSSNGLMFLNVSDVSVNGNTITVTAPEEIQILQYGSTIAFSDEAVYNDPSKQVTIFNGEGLPMDQGYWDFREQA